MKKLLLVLFVLSLILSSCFREKINEATIISKDQDTISSTNLEDIDNNKGIKTLEIPLSYKIGNMDLLPFSKMLKNDRDFFKSGKEGLSYFNIWRDFLFGENNTKGEVNKLKKCFDSEISVDKLEGIYKNICKGEDKYIKETFTNFYHIKLILLNFKKVKNSKEFNCNFFLNLPYKMEDSRLQVKISDYFSCIKLKDLNNYDLRKEYFYFNKAAVLGKCNSFEDKNLIKLCNERNKEFSKAVEK